MEKFRIGENIQKHLKNDELETAKTCASEYVFLRDQHEKM